MFEKIQATMQTFAEGLVNTQATIARVAELQEKTQQQQAALNESIAQYVTAADARMRQLEANLDALIRIITTEHNNGRGNG